MNQQPARKLTACRKAVETFLIQLLHHLTCNAVWAFPCDGPCPYRRCGNWLHNSTSVPARKEANTP